MDPTSPDKMIEIDVMFIQPNLNDRGLFTLDQIKVTTLPRAGDIIVINETELVITRIFFSRNTALYPDDKVYRPVIFVAEIDDEEPIDDEAPQRGQRH